MAMGYVFERISHYEIKMPASGYLLIKASDAPLGNFYNEHLERHDFFPEPIRFDGNNPVCLDRSSRAAFNSGWYAAENLPPIARWMARAGQIRFQTRSLSRVRFDLTCHMPKLAKGPLGLEFWLKDKTVGAL